MKFNELTLKSHTKPNRVGRGISAGQGKTAGRGTKGQRSRTGKKIKLGFEGGQTKLSMRLPKLRGFKRNSLQYQIVSLTQLEGMKAKTVDGAALAEHGYIKYAGRPVKIVGTGTVQQALTISVAAATASAVTAIEKAGGKITITTPPRTPKAAKAQAEPAK